LPIDAPESSTVFATPILLRLRRSFLIRGLKLSDRKEELGGLWWVQPEVGMRGHHGLRRHHRWHESSSCARSTRKGFCNTKRWLDDIGCEFSNVLSSRSALNLNEILGDLDLAVTNTSMSIVILPSSLRSWQGLLACLEAMPRQQLQRAWHPS